MHIKDNPQILLKRGVENKKWLLWLFFYHGTFFPVRHKQQDKDYC